MNKATALKIAAQYFESYPKQDEFHITSDGQVFKNSTFADNHARTLAKGAQDVIPVKRSELADSEEFPDPPVVTDPDPVVTDPVKEEEWDIVKGLESLVADGVAKTADKKAK